MKRFQHNATLFSLLLGVLVLGLAACDSAVPDLAPPSEAVAIEAPAAANGDGGFVILETPETTGFPLYAFPEPALATDEGETLLLLLRDPACIPADANLLAFPPPGPVTCPLTMHTKEWWLPEDLALGGPGPWDTFGDDFRVPMQARFNGDAVPVWIVDQADLLASFGDGVLTIGELAALVTATGTATQFHWVQQNSNRASSTPSQRPNHAVVRGSGALDDGRSFRFHLEERRGEYNHIDLVIE